jgi:hypothetical protein
MVVPAAATAEAPQIAEPMPSSVLRRWPDARRRPSRTVRVRCGGARAGEQVALGRGGVARQDERADAGVAVRVDLGRHLVGVADDRGAGAAAGAADAGPQVRPRRSRRRGGLAQRRLALHADRGGVERLLADRLAGLGVELRHEALGGGAGLGLGLAHDHVRAQAVGELRSVPRRRGRHLVDRLATLQRCRAR